MTQRRLWILSLVSFFFSLLFEREEWESNRVILVKKDVNAEDEISIIDETCV